MSKPGAIVRFTGKLPENSDVLAGFVRWMVGTEFSPKITLKARKRFTGHTFKFGHAVKRTRSYAVHFVHGDLSDSLHYLAHEVQHVLQYERGHLANTRTHILWHGEPYITVEAYKALGVAEFATYLALPWEAEAKQAEVTKPHEFVRWVKAGRRSEFGS